MPRRPLLIIAQAFVSPTRGIARLPFMMRLVASRASVWCWNAGFYVAVAAFFALDRLDSMPLGVAIVFGLLALSRINELLIAFGYDAIERFECRPRRLRDVTSTDRIRFLAAAYLETIAQFAVIHMVISRGSDGASYTASLLHMTDAIYFSAITITSTGFGDIAPVGPWARAATAYEAVLGVFFLAITLSVYLAQQSEQSGRAG